MIRIGESFIGEGVNAAHTNVVIGPKDGPAGQAFANSLASPSAGHEPFMVVVQPGVPIKPLTLFVNKAVIDGELHGNATWGAAQAGVAVGVHRAVVEGALPAEAPDDWWWPRSGSARPATTWMRSTGTSGTPPTRRSSPPSAGCPAGAGRPGGRARNPFYTPKEV